MLHMTVRRRQPRYRARDDDLRSRSVCRSQQLVAHGRSPWKRRSPPSPGPPAEASPRHRRDFSTHACHCAVDGQRQRSARTRSSRQPPRDARPNRRVSSESQDGSFRPAGVVRWARRDDRYPTTPIVRRPSTTAPVAARSHNVDSHAAVAGCRNRTEAATCSSVRPTRLPTIAFLLRPSGAQRLPWRRGDRAGPVRVALCRTIGIAGAVRMGAGALVAALCPEAAGAIAAWRRSRWLLRSTSGHVIEGELVIASVAKRSFGRSAPVPLLARESSTLDCGCESARRTRRSTLGSRRDSLRVASLFG